MPNRGGGFYATLMPRPRPEGQWHWEVHVNPGNTEPSAAQFTDKGATGSAGQGLNRGEIVQFAPMLSGTERLM
jgi:hypothetical protein